MRLFEIEPYNHRQKYVIKKRNIVDAQRPLTFEQQQTVNRLIGSTGIQAGSGNAINALGKFAEMAGKIATMPSVQNIGKAGLEMGTILAGNAIANKFANSGHLGMADAVQSATTNPGQTLRDFMAEKDNIREQFKNKLITKEQALSSIKQINSLMQSGGVANLKHLAKRQHGKGRIMQMKPSVYRSPAEINNANGLQTGGFAFAAPMLIAGTLLPLLSSLVSPIIEKVSSKYFVPALPGLKD